MGSATANRDDQLSQRRGIVGFIQTHVFLVAFAISCTLEAVFDRFLKKLRAVDIGSANRQSNRNPALLCLQRTLGAPFPAVSRVFVRFFAFQRAFVPGTIDRLPTPVQPDQIAVNSDRFLPDRFKNAKFDPRLKVIVSRATESKFWRNSVPLASRSQSIKDRVDNISQIRPPDLRGNREEGPPFALTVVTHPTFARTPLHIQGGPSLRTYSKTPVPIAQVIGLQSFMSIACRFSDRFLLPQIQVSRHGLHSETPQFAALISISLAKTNNCKST